MYPTSNNNSNNSNSNNNSNNNSATNNAPRACGLHRQGQQVLRVVAVPRALLEVGGVGQRLQCRSHTRGVAPGLRRLLVVRSLVGFVCGACTLAWGVGRGAWAL